MTLFLDKKTAKVPFFSIYLLRFALDKTYGNRINEKKIEELRDVVT